MEKKEVWAQGGKEEEEEKKYPGGAPWIFLAAFFHLTVTAGNTVLIQVGADACGRDLICVINAPNGNAEYGFRSAGRSRWSDQFRRGQR